MNYRDQYGFCSTQEYIDRGCPSWMGDSVFWSFEALLDFTADKAYAPANEGQEGNINDIYEERMSVGDKATVGIAAGATIIAAPTVVAGSVATGSQAASSVSTIASYAGAGARTTTVISSATNVVVATGMTVSTGAAIGGTACVLNPAASEQLRSSCAPVASTGAMMSVSIYTATQIASTVASYCPSPSPNYTKSNLQMGRQVHKSYKAELHNPSQGLYKEFTGIKGIRPDFVDFNTRTIYELKPNNPDSIKLGTTQLEQYRLRFEQTYGGTWNTVLETY